MIKRMTNSSKRAFSGQTIAEYAVLLATLTAAIVGMQLYARRGIQMAMKVASDRISPFANDADGKQAQVAGIRYEAGDRRQSVVAAGTTIENASEVSTQVDKTTQVAEQLGGVHVTTVVGDVTTTTGRLDPATGLASRSAVVSEVKE